MLLPKPKSLSWVQAAALPENWMTGEMDVSDNTDHAAYQALFLETGMKEGDNVLIHAVSTAQDSRH